MKPSRNLLKLQALGILLLTKELSFLTETITRPIWIFCIAAKKPMRVSHLRHWTEKQHPSLEKLGKFSCVSRRDVNSVTSFLLNQNLHTSTAFLRHKLSIRYRTSHTIRCFSTVRTAQTHDILETFLGWITWSRPKNSLSWTWPPSSLSPPSINYLSS